MVHVYAISLEYFQLLQLETGYQDAMTISPSKTLIGHKVGLLFTGEAIFLLFWILHVKNAVSDSPSSLLVSSLLHEK